MNSNRIMYLAGWIGIALVWGATPVFAQVHSGAFHVVPPAGDLPVPVTVGMYVVDITAIDEARNTFDVEMDIKVSWTDPANAIPLELADNGLLIYVGPEVTAFYKSIWSPQISVANPVGGLNITSQKLIQHADGRVEVFARVATTLRAGLDFRRFPFDAQVLPIELESYAWNHSVVELIADPDFSGLASGFASSEWSVERLDSKIYDVQNHRDREPFTRLQYEIEIQRNSGYYVWKIFLTVMIIVALSWVVFWMNTEFLGRRAGVSSTGILTVIAYQFVTSSTLPRVPYLTVADRIMLVSLVVIAATMMESIIVDRLDSDKPGLKLKVDRACRWIFPVGYFAALFLVIATSGVL